MTTDILSNPKAALDDTRLDELMRLLAQDGSALTPLLDESCELDGDIVDARRELLQRYPKAEAAYNTLAELVTSYYARQLKAWFLAGVLYARDPMLLALSKG